ncbi:MAG: CPBP family intramembrane metalloprotease [Actinobacteria bacterium]|nr:CPBP family intramembrane metalloprotease [Actinomycetota bacterium]
MGEETGWRGFLFPSLCEHISQRSAVIASGFIWGLWHAPIIYLGHNYGTDYWGYPVLGIAAMCVFCIFAGSLLCYLTLKTDSIWPAALSHGAINAIAGLGIYFMTVGTQANPLLGPAPTGLVAGIPLIALGTFCWIKLSSEKPSEKNLTAGNV